MGSSETVSLIQRGPRVATACSAKAAAAGVDEEDLAGKGLGASTGAGAADRRDATGAGAADRRDATGAGAADRRGVLSGFVRASGANADDAALAIGRGLDRELAEVSSGMKELAKASSSAVDGLEVVRDKVDVLTSRVLERVKFEDEALSTIDVLSDGMQSIAAQRNDF